MLAPLSAGRKLPDPNALGPLILGNVQIITEPTAPDVLNLSKGVLGSISPGPGAGETIPLSLADAVLKLPESEKTTSFPTSFALIKIVASAELAARNMARARRIGSFRFWVLVMIFVFILFILFPVAKNSLFEAVRAIRP